MREYYRLIVGLALLVGSACNDAADAMHETVREGNLTENADAQVPPGHIAASLLEWAISLSADSVAAGIVTFDVENAGTHSHQFEVRGIGAHTSQRLEPGESKAVVMSLGPGEYTISCSVDSSGINHRDRGMDATLTTFQAP